MSLEKLFILAIVAMFVLGPERLPTAASWLAKTLRQIKSYTAAANQRIRSELGPEFDDIRQPLDDLRTDWTHLRTWRDPRTALIHHLRNNPITTDHLERRRCLLQVNSKGSKIDDEIAEKPTRGS